MYQSSIPRFDSAKRLLNRVNQNTEVYTPSERLKSRIMAPVSNEYVSRAFATNDGVVETISYIQNDQKFKQTPVLDSSGYALRVLDKITSSPEPKGRIYGIDIASMKSINNAGNGDKAISSLILAVQGVLNKYSDTLGIEFGRIRGDMFMLYLDVDYKDEEKEKLVISIIQEIESEASKLEIEYKYIDPQGGERIETKGVSLHVDNFDNFDEKRFDNLIKFIFHNGFVPDNELLNTTQNLPDVDKENIFNQNLPREGLLKKVIEFTNKIPALKKHRSSILQLKNDEIAKLLFVLEKKYTNPFIPNVAIISEQEFKEEISKFSSLLSVDFMFLKYINSMGDSYGDSCIDQVWREVGNIIILPEFEPLKDKILFSKHFYKPMIGLRNDVVGSSDEYIKQLFFELSDKINRHSFMFETGIDDSSVSVMLSSDAIRNTKVNDPDVLIDEVFDGADKSGYENILKTDKLYSLFVMVLSDSLTQDFENLDPSKNKILDSYGAIVDYFFNSKSRGPKHTQDFFEFILGEIYTKTSTNHQAFRLMELIYANDQLGKFLTPDQKQIANLIIHKRLAVSKQLTGLKNNRI